MTEQVESISFKWSRTGMSLGQRLNYLLYIQSSPLYSTPPFLLTILYVIVKSFRQLLGAFFFDYKRANVVIGNYLCKCIGTTEENGK